MSDLFYISKEKQRIITKLVSKEIERAKLEGDKEYVHDLRIIASMMDEQPEPSKGAGGTG